MSIPWNFSVALSMLLSCAVLVTAQAPSPAKTQAPSKEAAAPFMVPKMTRPPADPAAVERGKILYTANCSFCHGATAKGGEGGPNLVRSELVLDDKNGELISQVVQNGRPNRGMPKFNFTTAQISDIAAFVHNFPAGSRVDRGSLTNPVVGDSKAGEAFFHGSGKCNTCHSVTGDLAGIGSKYKPRTLQALFLTGGASAGNFFDGTQPTPSAITATVTLANGEKVEGKLDTIDDFYVSLIDAGGNVRTFPRSGEEPKIEIHNPIQPHLDMWRTLTDPEIHDLTAYLVTVK